MLNSTVDRLDSFIESVVFSESILSFVVTGFLTVILIVSARLLFMFRQHTSWITILIRSAAFLSAISSLISVALVLIVANSEIMRQGFSSLPALLISMLALFTGMFLAYQAGRHFEPWIIKISENRILRAGSKDTNTDIRKVQDDFTGLSNVEIDLHHEFANAKRKNCLYLGVTLEGTPIEIDRAKWKKSHVQIMGPPGTGKGIQASIALTQSLAYGDAVFVLDPKNDEWAPSVFQSACEKASVPFHLLDLNESVPQVNLLANSTADEVSEMFYAGFGLSRSGSDSDYYRLDDRKAARLAASRIENGPLSLAELNTKSKSTAGRNLLAGAKAFFSALDEVSELRCHHTRGGIDLSAPLHNGGCVYIVGSMRNDPVVILQKMFFIRIVQIVEKLSNKNRHCTVFLDEFKYLLSGVAVNTLGSIRDKGCNILLAHQSLGDFANSGTDVSEAAVRTTVLDTTPIKWLYRPSDRDTAEWISNQTGEIVVSTQTMIANTNIELSESLSTSRTIGESQRNLFDLNTTMSLPEGCAICIGVGIPKIARVSPLNVSKRPIKIEPAPPDSGTDIELLQRIPLQEIEVEVEPQIPYISLFNREPKERVLRLLFEETWSHTELIEELFDDLDSGQTSRVLTQLEELKLVRQHELNTGYSSSETVWGISKLGVTYVQENFDLVEPRPAFNKSSVNLVSIRHKLDLQRMRLKAEKAGWTHWQQIRSTPTQRYKVVPDAVAIHSNKSRIAIEVERTVKAADRYPGIVVEHLNARRLRQWDKIYYLCPNLKIANRIRDILTGVNEVEFAGRIVRIKDEDKLPF